MKCVHDDDAGSALSVRIASKPSDLHAAYRLVYRAYLRGGLCEPNPYRMRVTPYHLLPTTEVFVAVSRGEVVCTLTLVGDGELGLPMETIYGWEVASRRAQGATVSEVSCLADREPTLLRGLPVLTKVMSLMAQRAKYRGIRELLIAVHPRHAPFYERFIGFRVIGREKAYEAVRNRPALGLCLDLDRLPVIHPRAYQRFFGSPFPEADLRHRPIPDEFRIQLSRIVDTTCANVPCVGAGIGVGEADELCA
jgi:hypothetical protein